MIICIILTAVWGAVIALSTLMELPPVKLIESAEAARNGAWMFLVYAFYGIRLRGTKHILAYRSWLPWYTAGIILVLLHLYAFPWLRELFGLPVSLERILDCIMWLGFSLAILVFTEQIYRASSKVERWGIRHLCLALVFMYGYDFLMYAEALIVGEINLDMWRARGAVIAFTAPLIAVTVVRSQKHSPDLQASPNVVFHTFMLSAAGIYLVYMAAVGYFINFLGGTWAGVIQITFLSASALAFILLVTSYRVRSLVRVWLSKHFFSYRYDYRREWLDFTHILGQSAGAAPRAVIEAMAKLCDSPGGLLWMRTESGNFRLVDHWHVNTPDCNCDLRSLADWLRQSEWIVDFQEWRDHPELYRGMDMPAGMADIPNAWLIVPLIFTDRIQGILLLTQANVVPEMTWEDRDLLKIAGKAAAAHLALYEANNTVVELKQFEGFNRLSAYVVHDLKNILAQQSLIIFNANHCSGEPEFLDDVIETVSNSVARMKRLMTQMRSGVRGLKKEAVNLGALLQFVVDSDNEVPRPRYTVPKDEYFVEGDPDQLAAVFGHIIKNAKEATEGNGFVSIEIKCVKDSIVVIIKDDGVGMDADFIEQRLFKPFDTTKGLTGMGIGAYESREYVRQLGGEIFVASERGVGSEFTIRLPYVCDPASLVIETEAV